MAELCIENSDSLVVTLDTSMEYKEINIEKCLIPPKQINSVLLILNQEINIYGFFLKLWNSYQVRVCADGGANRLYNFFEGNEHARSEYIPDYIIGDLDSLNEDVKDYYKERGVLIIKQTTQYSTDFSKSVNLISLHFNSLSFRELMQRSNEPNHGISLESGIHDLYNFMKEKKVEEQFDPIDILAIGGIDGRFDQTIHSITQLYTLASTDHYINLHYLTPTDIIVLAPSGGLLLTYSPEFRRQCIGNCGLLPVARPTQIIETRGLKWDVQNWDTSIATGEVSSSNKFVGVDKCYINTRDSIVVSIEMKLNNLKNYI